MGVVDAHKPTLPAPTDSSIVNETTTGDSVSVTDAATDLSRMTNNTSHTIPEDGSPIIISTKSRKYEGKLTKAHHQSHTSLLIEYFEGGNDLKTSSRPSVRVKVTPPNPRKNKGRTDHIQISETKGNRKASTRRIPLGPRSAPGKQVAQVSESVSSAEESNVSTRPPLEIEVTHKGDSDVSATSQDPNFIPLASDISSMPPDSMIGETDVTVVPTRTRSRSISRNDDTKGRDLLKTPARSDRSISRERIARKAVEKLTSQGYDQGTGRRRNESQSRTKDYDDIKVLKQKAHKAYRDEVMDAAESQVSSQVSSRRRSGEQHPYRSETSKASISNPKLLETVEDAIRRLILPELRDIKKDRRSKGHGRSAYDQTDSLLSVDHTRQDDDSRRNSKYSAYTESTQRPDDASSVSSYRNNGRGSRTSGHERRLSDEAVGQERRRRRHDRPRDSAGSALLGGVLTKEALKHHESRSSMDGRQTKKSHSRSQSASRTEEIFQKHDVPPMPLRSAIESDITRTSILSEQTAESQSSSTLKPAFRNVSRGSVKEIPPPTSRKSLTPVDVQNSMGTYHSNKSQGDLSLHSIRSERSSQSFGEADRPKTANVGALASDSLLERRNEIIQRAFGRRAQVRSSSPAQSIASYKEDTEASINTDVKQDRASSFASDVEPSKPQNVSIESMSSAATTDMVRSKLAKSPTIDDGDEKDATMESPLTESEISYDNRNSYPLSSEVDSQLSPDVESRRVTNFANDSTYLDRMTSGKEVRGVGSNPEYRRTPLTVESAVASLHEPSDVNANRSERYGYTPGSPRTFDAGGLRSPSAQKLDPQSPTQSLEALNTRGSPLKNELRPRSLARPSDKPSKNNMFADSPRQSIARSLSDDEQQPVMGSSGIPLTDDPMPEIGHGLDAESDINTNPSIIQGPGGIPHDNDDHWAYNATTQSKDVPHPDQGHASLQAAEADLLGAMAGAGIGVTNGSFGRASPSDQDHALHSPVQNTYSRDSNPAFGPGADAYMHMNVAPASPKDEGYISAANPRSPGAGTPAYGDKGFGNLGEDGAGFDGGPVGEGQGTVSQARHFSGYSQGLSPLYDSATGNGIDRIHDKDIVALMDHLTVRDAQRSARDTEILVTLVRSAAEMRTSFESMKKFMENQSEDVKKFVADQDDLMMDSHERQLDKTTQKILLQGPRPPPPVMPRATRLNNLSDDNNNTVAEEPPPVKKKNVFKRALRGLGMRSSNDLGRIEDMLVQLLDEVEGLKAAQANMTLASNSNSFRSSENFQDNTQDGYEPEGQAGTSSTDNQSGYFSNTSLRPFGRRESQNRISTVREVEEEDEEDEEDTQPNTPTNELYDKKDQLLSPPPDKYGAGSAEHLTTPPQAQGASPASLGAENTPRSSTDKSRKHKSGGSSSFFPKISRWSKTTTSSTTDPLRNSIQRKDQSYSEASRSGSDVQQQYDMGDYYDVQGDDRLRSMSSLQREEEEKEDDQQSSSDGRSPSPLISSVVSEQPKYQAHRDSMNLQHPQPRPGPTDRHQFNLESEAQNYNSPMSPTSVQWDSATNLPSLANNSSGNRNSFGTGGRQTPLSEGRTSRASSKNSVPPPRPPKIRDDGPLVPQRPPKMTIKDGQPLYADQASPRATSTTGYNKSNLSLSVDSPQRKPTGPRPITSSGNWSPDRVTNIKKNRYRGSPNPFRDSAEDVAF